MQVILEIDLTEGLVVLHAFLDQQAGRWVGQWEPALPSLRPCVKGSTAAPISAGLASPGPSIPPGISAMRSVRESPAAAPMAPRMSGNCASRQLSRNRPANARCAGA